MGARLEAIRRQSASGSLPRFGIRLRLIALALLAFLPPALLCIHLTLHTWDMAEQTARTAIRDDAD